MTKRIELYALVSGLLFLLSGIAKAVDISVFARAISQYGFGNLQFVAPLIVVVEVALGLLLLFQLWQKRTALWAAILVAMFTLVYAYGVLFHGVEDCGCFGTISFLNSSPLVTFVRNAVLLYLLIAVWRKGENKSSANVWAVAAIILALTITAFMTGYTFRKMRTSHNQENFKAQAIEHSELRNFVQTSKDSTYFVFVFSYSCPHCLNSIANLKEYERAGVVDRVIALALGDSIQEKKFAEVFQPNFTIINHSKELLKLTNSFPKSFIVRNDSIVREIAGELPSAYLLKSAK
ncbi:MAG: DoxX family membrane protein [Bacteroidales bacterium]|jgi:hypothetical protein|nr:DoxX family membrane protein [Bacteroidales bacterium]